MADTAALIVQVLRSKDTDDPDDADPDDAGLDDEELDVLCAGLRRDLLETDVASVAPVSPDQAPAGAKGLASLVGWLAVRLGGLDQLRAVVATAREWSTRTNRTVEISYGTDVLKVSGVTSAQQERLIDDWIARHSGSA